MHDELARGTEQLITESLNVYKLMFTENLAWVEKN